MTAERHRDRHRLPQRLRPPALIERHARKAVVAREVEHQLVGLQAFDRQPLDAEVDALLGHGQFDIGGHARHRVFTAGLAVAPFALPTRLPQLDQQLAQRT